MSFVEKDSDGDAIDVSAGTTFVHIGIQSESLNVVSDSHAVWLEADAAVRVAEAILEAVKEIRS